MNATLSAGCASVCYRRRWCHPIRQPVVFSDTGGVVQRQSRCTPSVAEGASSQTTTPPPSSRESASVLTLPPSPPEACGQLSCAIGCVCDGHTPLRCRGWQERVQRVPDGIAVVIDTFVFWSVACIGDVNTHVPTMSDEEVSHASGTIGSSTGSRSCLGVHR